jgi:hypothetical protein
MTDLPQTDTSANPFRLPKWPKLGGNLHPYNDWKNNREYDSYKNLKNSEYAWEFLRRNPQYMTQYSKLHAELKAKKIAEDYAHPQHRELVSAFAKRWDLNQLYSPGTSSAFIREIKERPSEKGRSYAMWKKEKDARRITQVDDFNALTRRHTYAKNKDGKRSRLPNPYVIIAFDTRKVITPMLNEVKKILAKKQEAIIDKGLELFPKKNPAKQNFPKYLQILDALIVNAKKSEIIKAIYPSKDEILDPDYTALNYDIRAALRHTEEYFHLFRSDS